MVGVDYLFDYVQFVQLCVFQVWFVDGIYDCGMFLCDIVDVLQLVVGQVDVGVVEVGVYVVVVVVVDDQDVFDFELVYCVLDDVQVVEVGVYYDVGDVVVYEYFIWGYFDDLVGWYV